MEVSRAKLVGGADPAVFEPVVPDVPVQRVEVLDADRRLRAAVPAAAQDGRFGHAVGIHVAGLDTELDVLHGQVGEFVRRGELPVEIDRRGGLARTVEGQSAHRGVPRIVRQHDAVGRAVPLQHGCLGILTVDAGALRFAVSRSREVQRRRQTVRAGGQIEDALAVLAFADGVQTLLQRRGVIGLAVRDRTAVGLRIQPSGQRTDEFLGGMNQRREG